MIALLTQIAPILIGFFSKLVAIRSQQAADQQRLMIEALAAREGALQNAREMARDETPMAAFNRRLIVLVVLSLVVVYVMAPLFFDIQTMVPVVEKGLSFLGFTIIPDQTVYQTLDGLVRYDEIFKWATVLVEFYFGASLAKGNR